MTLRDFFDRFERSRRTVTIYAPPPRPDVVDQFETRAASVTYTPLPAVTDEDDGFLVIRGQEEFLGSIGLAEAREFLEPPVYRPRGDAFVGTTYQALLEVLDDTLWHSLDSRQLLATSREIEDRAWRVGTGTLRVGFQRLSLFREQLPLYEELAEETEVDVRVYGQADEPPPDPDGITVRVVDEEDDPGEISDFWLLAFDGGDVDRQACALLAEDQGPDEFSGFWTYDRELVDELASYIERTYD